MANQYTATSYVTDTEAQCSLCKKIKPHTEFYKCKTYKHRKECSYYCKECSKSKGKLQYDNNPNRIQINKRTKEKNRAKKKKLVELFGNVCYDCKQSFPEFCYDFHHLDMTTKEHNPSYFIKMSEKRAMEELTKCVMLCSNCHRIRHFS